MRGEISSAAHAKRHPLDWYVEEHWCTEQLIHYIGLEVEEFEGLALWDPACGYGHTMSAIQSMGFKGPLHLSDLVENVAWDDFEVRPQFFAADFLALDAAPAPCSIVCNPPYSYRKGILEAFVRQALRLATHKVCMLVPNKWLSSQSRHQLFTVDHPPARVLHLCQRPSMPPGDRIAAMGIGTSEAAGMTRLVFADLFANYGIPKKAFLDNGRAFASKWITGGAKTRFRFKIRDEEPTGLLTGFGIETGFTLPYRGQSKPIERAWRELCDTVSKSAAFDGAYTGNNVLNKPENYGKRAVPWAEFIAEVERGVALYNSRIGRKTEMARGRSFDAVFAESYATAPIGKASPEQLRMALLTGENLRVNRQTGEITLYGNRYWAPFCGDLQGQLVTVRFDPGNLASAIHLYDLAGRYLGAADMIADTGFDTSDSAKSAARLVADHRKATKAMLEAERKLSAAEVAAAQGWNAAPEVPEPAVLRPVRHRGQTSAALKLADAPAPAPRANHESRVFAALDRLRVVE